MKRLLILTIVFATILGAKDNGYNLVKDGNAYIITWEQEVVAEHQPSQLALNALLGDIYVTGQNIKAIHYTEKMHLRVRLEKDAIALWEKYHFLLKSSDYGFEMVSSSDNEHFSNKVSVEYVLDLPVNTSVAARTIGGDIVMNKLSGEVDVATAGGDISLKELNGKLVAKTAGGDINGDKLEGMIELYTAGGDVKCEELTGDLHLESAGGDIELIRSNGNLELRTLGGDIDLRDHTGKRTKLVTLGGVVDIKKSVGDIDVSSSGGDINVISLNGSIIAKTAGGDINAEDVIGSAEFESAGGDINAEVMGGKVKAETVAGNVYVSKYYHASQKEHDIVITTTSGNIKLAIPDIKNAQVSARAFGSDTSIDSDFDLKIVRKDTRKVVAEIRNGDGSQEIELSTEDGDISIRKQAVK